MTKFFQKLTDCTIDQLDKASSAGSRAGTTVERVAKMRKAKVDPEVIALQMTKNSAKGQNYTTDDIKAYAKLYKDTETRVPITKAQTTAIIEDQTPKEPKTVGSLLHQGA